MATLRDLQDIVGAWHWRVFPLATTLDCLIKLTEETAEAMKADKWHEGHLEDELADCLIVLLASAERAGIDLSVAFNEKFPKVKDKYGQ